MTQHVGIWPALDSLRAIEPNPQCLIFYSVLYLATLLCVAMFHTNLIIWEKVIQFESRPDSPPNMRRGFAFDDGILFWEFASELLKNTDQTYCKPPNITKNMCGSYFTPTY